MPIQNIFTFLSVRWSKNFITKLENEDRSFITEIDAIEGETLGFSQVYILKNLLGGEEWRVLKAADFR